MTFNTLNHLSQRPTGIAYDPVQGRMNAAAQASDWVPVMLIP
jgi:hypothetical protein